MASMLFTIIDLMNIVLYIYYHKNCVCVCVKRTRKSIFFANVKHVFVGATLYIEFVMNEIPISSTCNKEIV